MAVIVSNKPVRQLLREVAVVLIIKIIFLYILWSIVFSQRDPTIRTTQAMTLRLLDQPILLEEQIT